MPRHRACCKKLLQIVFQNCPAVLHIPMVTDQLVGKARGIVGAQKRRAQGWQFNDYIGRGPAWAGSI